MSSKIRVLGFGSPHGDDQAGWRVVERLQRHSGLAAVVRAAADPLQLVDVDASCFALIVVDACSSGVAAGTISRLEWPDSRIGQQHGRSSHSLSVAEAIALAAQIGRLPDRVIVIGIEMGRAEPVATLSPEVASALPDLERQILHEVNRFESLRIKTENR